MYDYISAGGNMEADIVSSPSHVVARPVLSSSSCRSRQAVLVATPPPHDIVVMSWLSRPRPRHVTVVTLWSRLLSQPRPQYIAIIELTLGGRGGGEWCIERLAVGLVDSWGERGDDEQQANRGYRKAWRSQMAH